ncbi:hypothetical protein HY950_03825 [Candidatus Gottesmanbacteria bacterium]|nr:hypothetical protein [Candidatus Gottesmanbacteria bacterium]
MAFLEAGSAIGDSRYVPESELTAVFRALNRIRSELGDALPTAAYLRQFRPARSLFKSPSLACDPYNPHNEGHIVRTQVLHAILTRLRLRHMPSLPLDERLSLEALRLHDVRLDGWGSYPTHAQDAVAFAEQTGWHRRFSPEDWTTITYFIFYHPERSNPPKSDMQRRLLPMLHTLQDSDASDLTRPPLHVPIHQIMLRTQEATEHHLPSLAILFQVVSAGMKTGDLYEDQLRAGEHLGLLQGT